MDNKETKRNPLLIIYDTAVMLLAVSSIIMAIMDICGKVGSDAAAFYTADMIILIIFAVDYIVRFCLAPKKGVFFKENFFDLLAILPFDRLFSFFRFARIFRFAKILKFSKLAKLSKLTRIVGFFGKVKRQLRDFLHTNGFVYMLYASVALIVISSLLISYVEGKPFTDALWWSIVTCTTVGYGDISPETGIGRIIAVILMIFGIGLISMLTGTITTFFSVRTSRKDDDSVESDELDVILKDLDGDDRRKLAEIAKILKS